MVTFWIDKVEAPIKIGDKLNMVYTIVSVDGVVDIDPLLTDTP
jgi:hypothetical protein